MERKEIAGIYCRLSQDDGSTGESGSIQTQKTLLTQYCQEHQIEIGGYYCDDGWSGTNFFTVEPYTGEIRLPYGESTSCTLKISR